MWDHINAYPKQYHCTCAIYLLSSLDLEFYIIFDRSVDAPGQEKDDFHGINYGYKYMLKL